MDNLNYISKRLVAEYREQEKTDFKIIERAYIKGRDKYIIEYDGGKNSFYGVATTFFESEGRKGAYSLDKDEFETWKYIRQRLDSDALGIFTEFELENEQEKEIDLNDYFLQSINEDHEDILKSISDKDVPF